MKRTLNHTLNTKSKWLKKNILDAASELDQVNKRDCDKVIKELEDELLKYKQLAWFIHTARAHNIKTDNKIIDAVMFHSIEKMHEWAETSTGTDVKFWNECIKTFYFLEKHVKEMAR